MGNADGCVYVVHCMMRLSFNGNDKIHKLAHSHTKSNKMYIKKVCYVRAQIHTDTTDVDTRTGSVQSLVCRWLYG